MSESERITKAVRAAFEHEPHINLHRYPIEITWSDEVLTLEGEVENVAEESLIDFMWSLQHVWGMEPFWMPCVRFS